MVWSIQSRCGTLVRNGEVSELGPVLTNGDTLKRGEVAVFGIWSEVYARYFRDFGARLGKESVKKNPQRGE